MPKFALVLPQLNVGVSELLLTLRFHPLSFHTGAESSCEVTCVGQSMRVCVCVCVCVFLYFVWINVFMQKRLTVSASVCVCVQYLNVCVHLLQSLCLLFCCVCVCVASIAVFGTFIQWLMCRVLFAPRPHPSSCFSLPSLWLCALFSHWIAEISWKVYFRQGKKDHFHFHIWGILPQLNTEGPRSHVIDSQLESVHSLCPDQAK